MSVTTAGLDDATIRLLVDSGPAALILIDATGTVTWANRTAADALGTSVDDLAGVGVLDLVHADDLSMAANAVELIGVGQLVGEGSYRLKPINYRLRTGDGSYRWFQVAVKPMHEPGEPPKLAIVFVDASRITDLSHVMSGIAAHQSIEHVLAELVRVYSHDRPALAVSITWTDDDGSLRHECGSLPTTLVAGDDPTLPWNLARTADGPVFTDAVELPTDVRAAAEAAGFGGCSAFRVADPGAPEPAVVVAWWPARDIAGVQLQRIRRDLVPLLELALERRTHIRSLNDAAMRDPLTGLQNRRRLLGHLAELSDGRRGASVFYCDLDGFKPVNDTHGHDVGDKVLVEVASRLASVTRDADLTARLGGDEFAVVLTDTDAEVASSLADRIRAVMARPFALDGDAEAVTLGVSIGVAIAAEGDTFDVDELLRFADAAMYDAKRNGSARHVVIHRYDA